MRRLVLIAGLFAASCNSEDSGEVCTKEKQADNLRAMGCEEEKDEGSPAETFTIVKNPYWVVDGCTGNYELRQPQVYHRDGRGPASLVVWHCPGDALAITRR